MKSKKTIEKEKKREEARRKKEEKRKKEEVEIVKKPKMNHIKKPFSPSSAKTLIAFGDGMYNKDTVKIKGQESGVTGLLRKKLIQRSNSFHNVIVDINEYNTSQLMPGKKNMKTTVKTTVKTPYGWPNVTVLVCKHCETVWNRDVNASKNMLNIATAIWKNLGRPVQYKSTESPQPTRVSPSGG